MFSYTGVYAQKKQMDQVRSIIKSGKNLDKAEKTMSELMKNSANKDNKKMYMLWYQTVQAQYDAAVKQAQQISKMLTPSGHR